jgi:hypothetical protein
MNISAGANELGFDFSKLNWVYEQNKLDPKRPVDIATAIVGGDLKTGRVDFFVKWQPNTYCPLHRHLGDTVSIVLQGEHFIEERDGSKRTRPSGHYACAPDGDLHWEHGGAQGSLVFFSLQSIDGRAFEIVDPASGNTLAIVSVADMLGS